MLNLSIDDLPKPPAGKIGWPWTDAFRADHHETVENEELPRISIVTPSLNQGRFIEQTIRSVLLQGYPNLQYVIVDGGSSDETSKVVERYLQWIDVWISEPDRGQTHAINKGLAKCRADVFNWLCADDLLHPGALLAVGRQWVRGKPHMICGQARFVMDDTGECFKRWLGIPPRRVRDFVTQGSVDLSQPATFISYFVLDDLGSFRESLYYTMDYEFYLRMVLHYGKHLVCAEIERELVDMTFHPGSKTATGSASASREWAAVLREYLPRLEPEDRIAVEHYLYMRDLHKLVENNKSSWPRLLRVALRNPRLLGFRYYWGNLRRALSASPAGSDEIQANQASTGSHDEASL